MASTSAHSSLREDGSKIRQEFNLDGQPAHWAPGVSGPRFWGEEDACIDLAPYNVSSSRELPSHSSSACSADEKYLAVSLDARLMIFDLEARTLQADEAGHDRNIARLYFHTWSVENTAIESKGQPPYETSRTRYLLFVEYSRRTSSQHGTCIMRLVDSSGRFLDQSEPLPDGNHVKDASTATPVDFSSSVHVEEANVDQTYEGPNGRQKLCREFPGRMPSFGSKCFSRDGQKFFFVQNGRTTRPRLRPPEERPQLVIWDIARQKEIARLKGHNENIKWAAWAADDQAIVTASWDQTFKIWDAETTECRHTIASTDSQSCGGCISPDGQYVVLSGGRPTEVAVYLVAAALKVAKLEDGVDQYIRGSRWFRKLRWDPCPDQVAMEDEGRVVLMDPNTGKSRVVLDEAPFVSPDLRVSRLQTLPRRFQLFWVEGGRMLVTCGWESTIRVWDRVENCKWRFERPKEAARRQPSKIFYLPRKRMIVNLCGDLKIRYWKL